MVFYYKLGIKRLDKVLGTVIDANKMADDINLDLDKQIE